MATYTGTNNNDDFAGTASADSMYGYGGNDDLVGNGGADYLDGGTGNDTVVDGDGQNPDTSADTLLGGDGDDTVYAGYLDNADGGTGTGDALILRLDDAPGAFNIDFTAFWTGITYVIDGATIQHFEKLIWVVATAYDDTIVLGTPSGETSQAAGRGGSDTLTGGTGNDTLKGGDGDDVIVGGSGSDQLVGGLGNDVYTMDAGDTVTEAANAGADEVRTAIAAYTLGANIENLTGTSATGQSLTGNGLANRLTGGAGNDTLSGGDGDDVIAGGSGADQLIGGLGNDIYTMDTSDTIVEAASAGTDEVRTVLAAYTLGANVEHLTGTSSAGQSLTGNAISNTLTGGGGNDVLAGGVGNDTLNGGNGADLLIGGTGADSLNGGTGADVFRYDSASDSTAAAPDLIGDFMVGTDKIHLSGIDADTLTGGDQAFHWIGANAFSGTGAASAGELRTYQSGSYWWVAGDTNGDGTADLVIALTPQAGMPLAQGDFLL